MSNVTDILLITANEDGGDGGADHSPNAEELSLFLVDQYGFKCELRRLDHLAGGNRRMQADVFGVSVNYCDTEAIIEKFMSIAWEYPESAQLLVKEEGEDRFTVYRAGI
jgi:hypothetical protein